MKTNHKHAVGIEHLRIGLFFLDCESAVPVRNTLVDFDGNKAGAGQVGLISQLVAGESETQHSALVSKRI